MSATLRDARRTPPSGPGTLGLRYRGFRLPVALSFLLVVIAGAPPGGETRGVPPARPAHARPGRELWLADFTKDFLDEMQADGAGPGGRAGSTRRHAVGGTCPPPYKHVPRDACRVVTCRSDTECHLAGHKCCNNGCTFTCMVAMPPLPLVDWKKEPPRKEKGISWLLPSSNQTDDSDAEYCSTSRLSEDEDVLLCPHGYICHIEFLGDPARGLPNRGRCMLDVHETPGSATKRFRIRTAPQSSDRCHIPQRRTYSNGARFVYHSHYCTCHDGSVECRVGRRRG